MSFVIGTKFFDRIQASAAHNDEPANCLVMFIDILRRSDLLLRCTFNQALDSA